MWFISYQEKIKERRHLLYTRIARIYSIQAKVSIRVDGAIELGTKISQSGAAAANVRVMPEPAGTQICR